MLFDLHAHTNRYSDCGQMSPEEYIEIARKKGLSGICLTEHDKFWPENEYLELCKTAKDLIIINGNEKRCWDGDAIQGDFLIFGCRIQPERLTIKRLTKIVHDAGGIVIAAHPFRSILGVTEELIYKIELDAIEAYSSNMEPWQTQLACSVAEKMNIPVVGSSDAHISKLVGYSTTKFNKPVKNEEDFVNAVKSRQFIPVPHEG